MISATVVGHLGGDAVVRQAGDTPVLSFSIASNSRKKENGQWVDSTDWVAVSLFGSRGEKIAGYLTKGKAVAVRGALTMRTYEHNGQTKTSLDLRADDVEMLGGKSEGQQQSQKPQSRQPPPKPADDAGTGTDDIPF